MERGSAKHGARLDEQRRNRPGGSAGMTPADVQRRSNLAKWLHGGDFPADRSQLIARAEAVHAPEAVVEAVRSLPDVRFANISEVAQALGLGVEPRRG
ncbi:hypothetical protein Misp01_59240 [Microtetraspora sp. NBRC 13810]|uniref:DUF2795 domain-containing protein n=1 Tax=Microtetraspora sp. NBRC 13810 TaxID=3030990 RepID=UPI0024A5C052|nr:DUF2795 domain-containing protein [Microtetraspora sp. NBRC 13810]GLW10796.1 hypothetical protein Misp01_59240 [Microtetraspora sp. NBRC 13810]